MKKLACCAAALALTLSVARAQDATPKTERKGPALLVRPDPGQPSQPLRVAGVEADVVVVSGIASVKLDLTFENPLERVLEGELILPLPQGASVSSLALEFDGKLREASVVEREKARVVFEAVERQNIDPGLLEWVAGNTFRTRVYPIPAKGMKRVVLGYEHPLAEGGRLAVPLAFGTKIRSFACRIACFGEKEPKAAKEGLPVKFEKPGPAWKGEIRGSEVMEMEPRDLVLDVALPLEGPEVVIEKARVSLPLSKDPELVFVARVPVPEVALAKVKPARVTVLWDASGSAAAREKAKELAFLAAYVKELGHAKVKLVVFSNDAWAIEKDTFEVKEGKAAELLAALEAIQPDGGTRLACLDLKKLEAETDHFLLVSDGLSNFGTGELASPEKPVTCVVAATSADFELLDRVAAKGALVNLLQVSTDEAVARALSEPRTLLGVEADAARVTLLQGAARLSGRVVSVAGRLRAGEKAKLLLRFGHGAVESARAEVVLDPGVLTESGRAERIWASRKIEALSRDKVANEDEIVRVAKAYGIVTPFTSLLVLDSLDQYVRYHVVPPKDMEDEYWKRVEAEKTAAQKSRETRLAEVRAKWLARVEWSKKEFKYPADLKVKPDAEKDAPSGEDRGGGRSAETPEAPPAPAPPPGEAPRNHARARGGASLAFDSVDKKEAAAADPDAKAIAIKPWDPKTPYLEALKAVKDDKALYAAYLEQRKSYATSTAFFLDAADFFYAKKQPVLAVRILSNLAELELESAPLLRILAYRLQQAGELDLAIATFAKVKRIRPEEPQSFRDLAIAQAEAKDFEHAEQNLEKVVLGTWDARFPDIDVIALGELNEVIRAGGKKGVTLPDDLLQPLEYALRVILTWDADETDMDLWVTEPSGEKAFYGHQATTIGGNFGKDYTQGYGPEEYLLKKAMKGTFKIQVNYYGNRQQLIAGDTTIQVLVVKNYGRPDEQRQAVTRRLKDKQEVIDVFDVTFGEK